MVLANIFTLVLMLVNIKFNIDLNNNTIMSRFLRRTGIALLGVSGEGDTSSIIMKNLINYLQIMGSI